MAQTWNPDNVLVYENKNGTIPGEYNTLIMNEVMEGSKLMQLAQYEPMTDKVKDFQYFAEGPGAYWVGEGEKIQTSTAKWLNVQMVAKKVGVIIPVSREFLHYKMSDFFTAIRPKIAEAFYQKIDNATLLDIENPFPQSVEGSIQETGKIVNGELSFENILDLQDLLAEDNFEANAFISNRGNRRPLRNAVETIGNTTEVMYDRATNQIDGLPVVDMASLGNGELIAGDFNNIYYGIPYNIDYRISEEAQLSTITNEDGTPVNLFEQELMALRATMDIGFMVVKDEAFAKIEPGEDVEGA